MSNSFVTLVRAAIDGVEAAFDPLTAEAKKRIQEYEAAHRDLEAARSTLALPVLQNPIAQEDYLSRVHKLEDLKALAELSREALKQLSGERSVVLPVKQRLSGFLIGLAAIGKMEKEILSSRSQIPPRVIEYYRWDSLEGQRKACLRHVDGLVSMLKDLGWKPSQQDRGIIGSEKKRLMSSKVTRKAA